MNEAIRSVQQSPIKYPSPDVLGTRMLLNNTLWQELIPAPFLQTIGGFPCRHEIGIDLRSFRQIEKKKWTKTSHFSARTVTAKLEAICLTFSPSWYIAPVSDQRCRC
jgi:hypothetical protein